MRKVIQTSQKQTSDSEEEKLMSLQEVFLVNPFPSQAKERERTTTAISGLICSGPYMKSGPIGSLVRTLLASSRWYSPARRLRWEVNPLYSQRVTLYIKDNRNMLLKPFAVILNVKDIPSSQYLYRLAASVCPTGGTGFGLLPTRNGSGLQAEGTEQQPAGTAGDHPFDASSYSAGHGNTPSGESPQMETGPCAIPAQPAQRGKEAQRSERLSGLLRDAAAHSGSQ